VKSKVQSQESTAKNAKSARKSESWHEAKRHRRAGRQRRFDNRRYNLIAEFAARARQTTPEGGRGPRTPGERDPGASLRIPPAGAPRRRPRSDERSYGRLSGAAPPRRGATHDDTKSGNLYRSPTHPPRSGLVQLFNYIADLHAKHITGCDRFICFENP
jgi:hypothetical protein